MRHLLKLIADIRLFKRMDHDHPCINELNALIDSSRLLRFLAWLAGEKENP